MRPSRLGLAVVLAAAAILRFWNLDHGIPHAIGPEEPEIVERAFQMMKGGTLNPGFHDYGQLQISIQLAVSIVRFVAGSTAGEWYSLGQATSHTFYLWGRAMSALLGVLTVLIVFRTGLRWGSRHALLAAALVAVFPLHVRYSQLVVPDVLFTLLAAVTMMLSVAATEKASTRLLLLAGITAGLTVATRYSGVLVLIMPVVACWVAPVVRPNRIAATLLVLGSSVAGFLVAAPYTVLDLPNFLDRFAHLAAEARQTVPPEQPGGVLYLRALAEQFAWQGVGRPVTILAWPTLGLLGVGLVMGLIRTVRGPARGGWTVALSFVLVFFWFVASQNRIDARFLLPLLPMLAIVTAAGLISGVSVLRRYEFSRGLRTAMITVLTIAMLGPSAVSAIGMARTRAKASTQDLAFAWVKENVPPTAIVVVEAGAMSIPRSIVSGWGMPELRIKTYDEFANAGVNYLIASSNAYGKYMLAPGAHREEYQAYTRLFSEAHEIARFSPSKDHPGPELRVLKVMP